MRMIMIWFAFSTLFSSIGSKALRGANIPVSDTARDRFELLILLFTVAAPYFKTSSLVSHAGGQRRYIEIVCGILGNALAAYYLKLQTAHLMLAFLSFAISLGIFANVKPSTDFGVIQFLVTSSIQCAVSLFGLLHVYTFVVLLVGLGVMVLKWKWSRNKKSGEKLWPYLIKTEGAAAYVSPVLVILPVIFFFRETGNIGHLILLSSNATYLAFLRRKLLFLEHSAAREEIFATVFNWKWWKSIGRSANPSNLFFYIHFRDILHLFLRHMARHSCRPNSGILPV